MSTEGRLEEIREAFMEGYRKGRRDGSDDQKWPHERWEASDAKRGAERRMVEAKTKEGGMKRARCKFTVTSTETAGESTEVTMETIYDPGGVPEDVAFTKYTPSGSMRFTVSNPALEGFFVVGESYYVDVMPVEPAVPGKACYADDTGPAEG